MKKNSVTWVGCLSLAIIFLWSTIVPATSSEFAKIYVVHAETALNARAGPGVEFEKIQRFKPLTLVTELSRKGQWSEVKRKNSDPAWVHNGYLRKLDKALVSRIGKVGISNVVSFPQPQIDSEFNPKALFSADGKRIVLLGNGSLGKGSEIYVLDAATGKVIRHYSENLSFGSNPQFKLSPDGELLAAIWSGLRITWNIYSGQIVHFFEFDDYTTVYGNNKDLFVATKYTDSIDVKWLNWSKKKELLHFKITNEGIEQIKLSANRKYIFMEAETSVSIFDANTGNVHLKIENILDAEFIYGEKKLVVLSKASENIQIWDVSRKKLLESYFAGKMENLAAAKFLAGGKVAYTSRKVKGDTEPEKEQVWDVMSQKEILLPFQNPHPDVEGLTYSPNGKFFIEPQYHAKETEFDSDLNKQVTQLVWNLENKKQVYTFQGQEIYGFSPDSKYFVAQKNSLIVLRETVSGNIVSYLGASFRSNRLFSHEKNDDLIYVTTANELHFWDLTKGLEVQKEKSRKAQKPIVLSPDKKSYLVLNGNEARLINLANKRVMQSFRGSDKLFAATFSPDGTKLAMGVFDGALFDTDAPRLAGVWNVRTGKQIGSFSLNYEESVVISFSADSKKILFQNDVLNDSPGEVWDVQSGEKLYDIGEATLAKFAPSSNKLLVVKADSFNAHRKAHILDSKNGKPLHKFEGELDEVVDAAFSPDGKQVLVESEAGIVSIYNLKSGKKIKSIRAPLRQVTNSLLASTQKIFVNKNENGGISIGTTVDNKERVQLVYFEDGSWVAFTPEGFFSTSSKSAAQRINVVHNHDVLSIDSFYNILYRPDLVLEALSGDPKGNVAEAARSLNLIKVLATGQPPNVHIMNGKNLPQHDGISTVKTDSVTVNAEISGNNGGIGKIEWRVNGVLQGVDPKLTKLEKSSSENADGIRRKVTKTLFLSPGKNIISIVVYNNANLIASKPDEVVVVSDVKESAKPQMYVLAVGIDDYYDSRLKLKYATNDARSIGNALKTARGTLYEKVNVTLLLDKEVSAKGMERVFRKIGSAIRPQDVFVFFLAGHGKTLKGRYYYLPQGFRYNGTESLRKNGISQDQFQAWLSLIPAQKSVMLYDTCESGSLTKQASIRSAEELTAIDLLSRAVGRTIMTASTDTGYALEGFRNHGLFTYTLLEAFAKSDFNKDNQIGITELISYVADRLPTLSDDVFNYRQIPLYKSQGTPFALGTPVSLLTETEEIIPKTSTHVIISKAAVNKTSLKTSVVLNEIAPGVQVRVLSMKNGMVFVARNGVKLGWVGKEKLLALK